MTQQSTWSLKKISPEQAQELVQWIEEGTTTPAKAREALGVTSNGPLRRAVVGILGEEAGGTLFETFALTEPSSGATPRRKAAGVPAPTISDVGVPVITTAKVREGYRTEARMVHGYVDNIYITPDGNKYVVASPMETASLIYQGPDVPPLRLRSYTDADAVRNDGEQQERRKQKRVRKRETKNKLDELLEITPKKRKRKR